MTKRTDIHRPSAIEPDDYVYVSCETHVKAGEMPDCAAILYHRELLKAHMDSTGGNWSSHEHGGNCHVCGAWMIDAAVFYHEKTNSYIRTGFDCADKMDMGDSRAFRSFRKARKSWQEMRAGKMKAEATLRKKGLEGAWAVWMDRENSQGTTKLDGLNGYWYQRALGDLVVVQDIVSRLVKYGSISDGQERYLHVLLKNIGGAHERQAAFKAEKANAEDAPEGRVKVTGAVLSTKTVQGDWNAQEKMTVKDDRGFRVFVSIPSGMPIPNRGDRVTVRATLTRSKDDAKFAFGKRPTGGQIIEAQEKAA